jgi:adenylate kinase family enzyme
MLREEVEAGTLLGKQVESIMKSGGLVSSAIMVALMQKKMKDYPGKRILLDGFPRSAENARDLVAMCGKPELALHVDCHDTVLIERILARGKTGGRADDNIHTALERIRTYHKYHQLTLDFLREEHVPIVNLDGSATAEGVWEQLRAVGEATDYMLICSLLRFAIFQFAFSKNRSRAHARITNPLISHCPRI